MNELLSGTRVEHRSPIPPPPPVGDKESDNRLTGSCRKLDGHIALHLEPFGVLREDLALLTPQLGDRPRPPGKFIEEFEGTRRRRRARRHGLEGHGSRLCRGPL